MHRRGGDAQFEVIAVCYDGICAMEQVVKGGLELLVIDLFLPEEYRYVKYAFRCGVHGFYSKRESAEEFLAALDTVLTGKKYLSSGLRLSPPLRDRAGEEEIKREDLHQCDVVMLLTRREMEVLKLLLEELSIDAIAQRLYISKNTAKAHKNRILKKLGMHSVDELLRYFRDNRVLLNG